MKKLVLWTIGIFFLLVIIGNCAGSDKENTIAESSSQMQLEEISPEDESKIDSIDVVKIKELKQYFTEKKDEFSDVKWVEPKSRPKYTNQNGYCMYFSVNNGVASNPRFLIQYESDKWLFIKNMIEIYEKLIDWYQSYDWYIEFAIRQKEKEFRKQHIVSISEVYELLGKEKEIDKNGSSI